MKQILLFTVLFIVVVVVIITLLGVASSPREEGAPTGTEEPSVMQTEDEGKTFFESLKEKVTSPKEEAAPQTSATQKTSPVPQSSQGRQTQVASTPRAFAEQVLEYNKDRNFGALYDAICSPDRSKTSKLDYIAYQVDFWGNVRVNNFAIQDVNTTANGVEVFYGETYTNGKSKGDTLTVLQEGGRLCYSSSVPQKVADIAYFGNISLTVTGASEPSGVPIKPDKDGIRVDFSLTNTGGETFSCHDPFDGSETKCTSGSFVLQDAGGVRYNELQNTLGTFTLSAGEIMTGSLVYEMPHQTSAVRYTLIFTDHGYEEDIATDDFEF